MTFLHLQSPIRWMFLFHAICGSLALGVLLLPLLSGKGGKVHVRSGWIYAWAMVIVGISAFVITPWRAFFDPERTSSSQAFAIFLAFVAILTLSSLWYGLAALKHKTRTSGTKDLLLIGPAILLAVSAVGVMTLGYSIQNSLLTIFPILGLIVSRTQIKYWTKTPTERMHWWFAHMDGMFTACIATITAFLVTAVPRMTSAAYFQSPILWVAPGLILGMVSKRWTEHYRVKFNSRETRSSHP